MFADIVPAGMAARSTARKRGLAVAIVVLCVVAAAGIIAVVSGDFVETVGRVLYTAAMVAIFFPAGYVQGSLLTRGPGLRALGALGIVVSLVGLTVGVYATWHDYYMEGEGLTRAWGSLTVAAVAFATFALLLRRRRPEDGTALAVALGVTLTATVALAGLLI